MDLKEKMEAGAKDIAARIANREEVSKQDRKFLCSWLAAKGGKAGKRKRY